MGISFQKLCTKKCSIKRLILDEDGKSDGTLTTIYKNIPCIQPVFADANLQDRYRLSSSLQLMMTQIEGDFQFENGDTLVIDSFEYPIRVVDIRPHGNTNAILLILEKIKGSK